MKDNLPVNGLRKNEKAIVYLDEESGMGTHWTAYKKTNSNVIYFDSYGNLQPPRELLEYWRVDSVKYNYHRYQDFNTYVCGHLCLQFLCGYLGI